MARGSLVAVRESLQNYADRGVFRGFSEVKNGQFRFGWGLHREMDLVFDADRQNLRFRRLLPGLAANSDVYRELRTFIAERHDASLPEHRRIDRRRAEVTCSIRGGGVSISLKVKNNQYAYGVNRIVNLVHELFVHLKDVHPGYLAENFDVPEE